MGLVNVMIKKILCLFLAMILMLTCFAGCKDENEDTYFACAVDEMPEHFDPQIASTSGEKIVAVNIFDGLFKLDENGDIQKCAVKDYKVSADGLVYTFYLRENMRYYISDEVKSYLDDMEKTVEGKVTAKDFAFGITRGILPETQASEYALLSNIKNAGGVHDGTMSVSELGVRVVGENTLEITLEQKQTDLLYALTQPISFPCDEEFFNLTNGRYGLDEEYIISNGSFYLSDIKEDESVRFSKNSEYTGDFAPIPTSVRLYVNSNEVDIAKKVDSKTYDLGFFKSDEAIDELGRKVTTNNLQNITTALVFNMSDEILQNVKLRTGLVSSIDRSAVVENPIENLVSPYYDLSGNKSDALLYSINNARNNMISAFEELEIKTLTVDILCMADYESTAKAIVNCWQANIGVELNGTITVAEDKADFEKKIATGEFDAAIYQLNVDSNRSVDFLSIFTSDNQSNVFGYKSQEYDRNVTSLRNNPTKANATYCESYLLKNAVALPLQYESTVFAVAKGTSGVYFAGNSSNIYFYKGQK